MMMRKADLVSAIRLPNNLFTDNANTEVGCDLIILQKNEGKEELSEEDKRLGDVVKNNHTGISTNGYFFDHPEYIIHTDAKRDTDPYGKPAMVYTHSGGVEASPRTCTGYCRRTCRHGWIWNATMASRLKSVKHRRFPSSRKFRKYNSRRWK